MTTTAQEEGTGRPRHPSRGDPSRQPINEYTPKKDMCTGGTPPSAPESSVKRLRRASGTGWPSSAPGATAATSLLHPAPTRERMVPRRATTPDTSCAASSKSFGPVNVLKNINFITEAGPGRRLVATTAPASPTLRQVHEQHLPIDSPSVHLRGQARDVTVTRPRNASALAVNSLPGPRAVQQPQHSSRTCFLGREQLSGWCSTRAAVDTPPEETLSICSTHRE